MSKDKQRTINIENQRGKLALTSKFQKVFLTVLAAVLTFAGPTYVVYVLINIVNLDELISRISGVALFFVGLFLIWYLIRNETLS
ncbi:MAG: hypothetical protein PVF96_02470 [Candidatus Bathyarchaeota archaeon]